MSLPDDCYIASIGEIVVLKDLNTVDRNGLLGTIEGIQNGRVVVRQCHDEQRILVLPRNLLEAGGDYATDDTDDVAGSGDDAWSDSDEFMDDEDYGEFDTGEEAEETDDQSFDEALVDANIVEANRLLNSSIETNTEEGLVKVLEAAKQLCNRALVCNADNWVAYQILGDVCTQQNKNDEAAAAFRAQLEILSKMGGGSGARPTQQQSPTKVYMTAMLNLAGALGRMGDTVGELQTYQRAADMNSSNVHVLANIGSLKLDSGDVDDAVHWFESAVAADPTWALGRFHLARALLKKGEKATAIMHLEVAVVQCATKRSDETAHRAARTYMMIADAMHAAGMDENSPNIVKALLRSVNILQSDRASATHSGRVCTAQAYYQLGLALETHTLQTIGT
jgi:tetratricopeptide (TPR) repeat protein